MEKIAIFYALECKGSYYTRHGELTDDIRQAILFNNEEDARAIQRIYDPQYSIDESLLLAVEIKIFAPGFNG